MPADDGYFGHVPDFTSDSPILKSSSQWLNDPVFREFYTVSALRRNHKDYLPTADDPQATAIIQAHLMKDFMKVEGMLIAERAKNPAFDAWMARRHMHDLSPEKIASYPDGSVGNLLHRFTKANKFTANLGVDKLDTETNAEYFMKQIALQHDLEHFFGGFGFDYIGEQGVTWMRMGSYYRHLSPELASYMSMIYTMLIVPLYTRTLIHYPQTMWAVWDCISQGMLIGRTSEPVYMMDYESVMPLPLAEAREKLGYRNFKDVDLRAESTIWSENITPPFDPRYDELDGVAPALAAE